MLHLSNVFTALILYIMNKLKGNQELYFKIIHIYILLMNHILFIKFLRPITFSKLGGHQSNVLLPKA